MWLRTLALLSAIFFSGAFKSESDPAIKFLQSLDKNQLEIALMDFSDQSKEKWHYLPGTMWPRGGIQLNSLNSNQKKLVFELLQDFLSETGYIKTKNILELENVLAELTGNTNMRDPEKYYVAFYGNPIKDDIWAWSFEGHHISLNFTVLNKAISVSPRFFGANPAIVRNGKYKGMRVLEKEEDYAIELINLLTKDQKAIALFQLKAFRDIVTGNSSVVEPLEKVGIPFKDLNIAQQYKLIDLIYVYLSAMPEKLAEKRLQNLKTEELDEIRFAWAGDTVLDRPHYYRIQGKTFLIELDNTQNNANHIHSVWRDFDGDFGRDLIREHYQNTHHH